eukprot:GGOE01019111.1.p1 GENE.GGOE01019111.1~~GGOE01019111.1.p1  ORF type:complete len:561 (-),score=158.79 GGOE01019111.1:289-1971(-)
MVQDATSASLSSSPVTSKKQAAMAVFPEGVMNASDHSLVETLERLLHENEELRSQLERSDAAAGRLGMEAAELKHFVPKEPVRAQADLYKPISPGVMFQEVEGLRNEAQLQGQVVTHMRSLERQARAELQALKSQLTDDPKDPSLEATVAALEHFQRYNEDLRSQLELKAVLVTQLEESERRLCDQLAQMCQAKAPDASAAVNATMEVLKRLQDRNVELRKECDLQQALLRQLQDPPRAQEAVGGDDTEPTQLAELQKNCSSQLTTIEMLRSSKDEIQQKLIQLTDLHALETRTPNHNADPMRLLRLLEDQLRVQAQAIQSMTSIQDDPQEAYEDSRVLGQRTTLLRRRIAALESEVLDTQHALRDSEEGRDRLLLQLQDLQSRNITLTQQTERYSVAVRALEKQLDLTRSNLENTHGKVTELTMQYEDNLERLVANITDLGLEVEILRDAAGQSGSAKLLACDELFKSNTRSHALREKVRRFHGLLQLRLTVFPAALQKLNDCHAAMVTHGLAAEGEGGPSPSVRAAEYQLEQAAAGLQSLIGSMLEVEHSLNETQLLC